MACKRRKSVHVRAHKVKAYNRKPAKKCGRKSCKSKKGIFSFLRF